MTCNEDGKFGGKWAIVTLHPSLPSKTEQFARMRAWGLPESTICGNDISAMVVDDVRKEKRTTNWTGKLWNRAVFIDGMRDLKPEGDKVFFATPLCVGFGPAHAKQTIEALWGAGMQVYVHSLAALYISGDDLEDLLAHVDREASTARVRAHRARNLVKK